jgi:hypothetical protein
MKIPLFYQPTLTVRVINPEPSITLSLVSFLLYLNLIPKLLHPQAFAQPKNLTKNSFVV